ncbi:alpha-glucan family phosphorylase [Corynebacterium halotolerans]|uniref:glycogen phosphorylase n=1 Tax=Corynebacterium halotolerans YIM 70093 = DSM 44683 TaxID=1121362 RepID=M1NN86_9CORY|nr:alpha-glucan family phosphorylase [Corynebacterium halotolerans]AGF72828.1 alpha-glucan phosphorylase [Corynebacterium halotolerans YIM 70093 = DSM 44683]
MNYTGTINVRSILPSELADLSRLAMNLRWSWRNEARELFREIDPELWDAAGESPVAFLAKVPASRLNELANDPSFVERLRTEVADLEDHLTAGLWYQKTREAEGPLADLGPTDPLVAYFSMEFGVHPSLPIYSGGLGILAGDHLKSASDLGLPLIGVGLLYTHGYFTQSLSADGWQEETYTYHDPAHLPIEPVLDAEGNQLTVTVGFPEGRHITIALWVATVGRVPLLLLDTNIEANPSDMREVTDRLYGGDAEHRIKQELVLGVGGVRAVNAYCDNAGVPRPVIAHLNEGHAGFLSLERIRERMASGLGFEESLAQVRAANIFTTHTPVPAGIDRFDLQLVRRYLGDGLPEDQHLVPGVPVERALDLGREADPHLFNMAHLGLRSAQHANGVARLHGRVSRDMFAGLYPGYEGEEVPIGSVTNGVHLPTWAKPNMQKIIARIAGGVDLTEADSWDHHDAVTDEELWAERNRLRSDLVDVARVSLHESWRRRGNARAQLGWARRVLDPDVLTVGFARRVSTYKRLTLMLRDPERLRSILLNPDRPVQFVIAGKAHPHDMGGKKFMQEIVRFADQAGLRDRFLFLPDYDISLAGYLVSGADIWLNNPVRPQEASGTSGMKAVLNGGLTLSISDGWWDEMDQKDHGWTIPTVDTHDQEYRDQLEAQALYDLLENEVAPLFYHRDAAGVPREWLKWVRRSLTELSPLVLSTRMVRDYTAQLYRPTAEVSEAIHADCTKAAGYVNWLERVRQGWSNITLSNLRCNGTPVGEAAEADAGQSMYLTVEADLGMLTEGDVQVQAVIGNEKGERRIIDMTDGGEDGYSAELSTDTPGAYHYTVRAVPSHELLVSPAELGLVTYYS